jgi:uncharacterized membrane protein
MAKKPVHKLEKKSDDSDSRLYALIGLALLILGYIIVVLSRKEDKYAMYYAKQGLILFIACVIAWAIGWALLWIPLIGQIIGWVINVMLLVLWIIGVVYSLSGEEKEVPVIGAFARKT